MWKKLKNLFKGEPKKDSPNAKRELSYREKKERAQKKIQEGNS